MPTYVITGKNPGKLPRGAMSLATNPNFQHALVFSVAGRTSVAFSAFAEGK